MKTTDILNNVIQTIKDGQAGFWTAADDVKSFELKEVFRGYSEQRSTFAAELQALTRTYGEFHPAESGTVAGALHRGWINLKSALSTADEGAVLTECERGEDQAVQQYEKALRDPELDSNAEALLRTQYVAVKAAHDRIRELRDSLVAR